MVGLIILWGDLIAPQKPWWFSKCLFSVCPVIYLFFCLAVNNYIQNMLGFSEFLYVGRCFLNQSDRRTFEKSVLMKQAILNMYLDIIIWLDILIANKLSQCFCLVMVRHTQPCLNQSDSKILEIPVTQEKFQSLSYFLAYGCTFIGVTNQCSFFIKVMLKCFKIIIQRLNVWICFFAYGYGSIGTIN